MKVKLLSLPIQSELGCPHFLNMQTPTYHNTLEWGRIEKIIDDYSFAKDEAEQRNRIKTVYKGPSEATESLWTYVKDPILLKVKGLASYTNSLITRFKR